MNIGQTFHLPSRDMAGRSSEAPRGEFGHTLWGCPAIIHTSSGMESQQLQGADKGFKLQK
jgi:hypothetical protein